MQPPSIQIDFHFYGTLTREDDWWISHCPPLDVASQGRTEKEAKANLREAVHLFVESCSERGTLFDALNELGFAPGNESSEPPAGSFPVDLSIRLLAQGNEACRA